MTTTKIYDVMRGWAMTEEEVEQFEEDWTTMWNPQGLENHDCSAEFL